MFIVFLELTQFKILTRAREQFTVTRDLITFMFPFYGGGYIRPNPEDQINRKPEDRKK